MTLLLPIFEELNELLADKNAILDELKWLLHKAQERMKNQADKKRRDIEFQVGDVVFLKIQPYRLRSLAKRINQKLSPRFYGPFEVEERIGTVAYKLKLPPGSMVHPVFHVSLLKKCLTPQVQSQPLPNWLAEDWELKLKPAEILAVRYATTGEKEVLVKWQDLLAFETSWESARDINTNFPHLHLEDKVNFTREYW